MLYLCDSTTKFRTRTRGNFTLISSLTILLPSKKRLNRLFSLKQKEHTHVVALGRAELEPRYEALQRYLEGVDFDTPGDWDQKLEERIYGK